VKILDVAKAAGADQIAIAAQRAVSPVSNSNTSTGS
jgi:hypothetical protein